MKRVSFIHFPRIYEKYFCLPSIIRLWVVGLSKRSVTSTLSEDVSRTYELREWTNSLQTYSYNFEDFSLFFILLFIHIIDSWHISQNPCGNERNFWVDFIIMCEGIFSFDDFHGEYSISSLSIACMNRIAYNDQKESLSYTRSFMIRDS